MLDTYYFDSANVVPHVLGYCLTLNDDQKLVQIVPGKPGGMTIMLDADVDTYMPNVVGRTLLWDHQL